MVDIIVNDESYFDIGRQYGHIGARLDDIIEQYIDILDGICAKGIVSGNIHDNLMAYRDKVAELNGCMSTAMELAKRICHDYVKSIDVADDNLY